MPVGYPIDTGATFGNVGVANQDLYPGDIYRARIQYIDLADMLHKYNLSPQLVKNLNNATLSGVSDCIMTPGEVQEFIKAGDKIVGKLGKDGTTIKLFPSTPLPANRRGAIAATKLKRNKN